MHIQYIYIYTYIYIHILYNYIYMIECQNAIWYMTIDIVIVMSGSGSRFSYSYNSYLYTLYSVIYIYIYIYILGACLPKVSLRFSHFWVKQACSIYVHVDPLRTDAFFRLSAAPWRVSSLESYQRDGRLIKMPGCGPKNL